MDRSPALEKITPHRLRQAPDNAEFREFVKPLSAKLPLFCRQYGKEVGLEVKGTDMAASYKPKPPLVNILTGLLEYCVACSIEPPLVRLSNGKPRRGVVVLIPARDNSHLSIRLYDDGCGIRDQDLQRLKGLVPIEKLGKNSLSPAADSVEASDGAGKPDWALHLQRLSRQAEALNGSLTLISNSSAGAGFMISLFVQNPP
jgi:hypothetical protein